jgi:23S rRNA (uridine2479-2'-O)-methyltransferase
VNPGDRRSIKRSNDVYQMILALKNNRKKRGEYGEAFVEGIESIKQALTSKNATLQKIMFSDYDSLSRWSRGLIDDGLFEEIIQLAPGLYEELSDKNEPSEIMITVKYQHLQLDKALLPEAPFILIFDRPGDFGNLGSIIRSANAFGVDLVITHGHCVDFLEPKVIRSSLGAVFHTPIVHVESISTLGTWLEAQKKEKGLQVIGSDSTGSVSLGDVKVKKPIALILGNEAKGMSQRLKELSDSIVKIPMRGVVNSINVACAGSILMWAVMRTGDGALALHPGPPSR